MSLVLNLHVFCVRRVHRGSIFFSLVLILRIRAYLGIKGDQFFSDLGFFLVLVLHTNWCTTICITCPILRKIIQFLCAGAREYLESVLRRKKLISYKPYIRKKHLESILGTGKNMTKKSIQFEWYNPTQCTFSRPLSDSRCNSSTHSQPAKKTVVLPADRFVHLTCVCVGQVQLCNSWWDSMNPWLTFHRRPTAALVIDFSQEAYSGTSHKYELRV